MPNPTTRGSGQQGVPGDRAGETPKTGLPAQIHHRTDTTEPRIRHVPGFHLLDGAGHEPPRGATANGQPKPTRAPLDSRDMPQTPQDTGAHDMSLYTWYRGQQSVSPLAHFIYIAYLALHIRFGIVRAPQVLQTLPEADRQRRRRKGAQPERAIYSRIHRADTAGVRPLVVPSEGKAPESIRVTTRHMQSAPFVPPLKHPGTNNHSGRAHRSGKTYPR